MLFKLQRKLDLIEYNKQMAKDEEEARWRRAMRLGASMVKAGVDRDSL